MSRRVIFGSLVSIAIGLTALCLASGRSAGAGLGSLLGPQKETLLYDGDLQADSGGIQVTFWGSGKAETVDTMHYVGPAVLKITSQGPYQGVVLRLHRAADLTPFRGAKDALIDLRVQPAQYKRIKETEADRRNERNGNNGRNTGGRGGRGGGMGGGGRGGRGGGMGGGGRGGFGGRGAATPQTRDFASSGATYSVELTQMGGRGMGGGGRGGFGGGGGGMGGRGGMGGGGRGGRGGMGGARGQGAGGNQPQVIGFSAHTIRLVLFTDKGEAVASGIPIEQLGKDNEGWYRVSYPLDKFTGAAGATKLEGVGISTDEQETFYLGQVRLVVDRTPVTAKIDADHKVALTGQVIDFSINFSGGYIDPAVSWNFNSGKGGTRQEAVGTKVKYLYKKPGDYLVVATIRDKTGVQTLPPQKIGIRVEQGSTAPPAWETDQNNNEYQPGHLEGTQDRTDDTITIEKGGSLDAESKTEQSQ